jgi:cytochrome c553
MKPSTTTAGLWLLLGLYSVPAGVSGCQTAPAATVDHGEYLFSNYCAQCHGPEALGKEPISAPSIAGLPDWYVLEQLHKYRGGVRGAHFDDIEGMRMRPMSLTLRTETDLQAVSMFVASLPPTAEPATLQGGDPEKGKALYATCNACHGPEGAGNVQLGSPPITIQNDWYLVKQLGKFKNGVRGTNSKDIRGAQMRPMAQTLPDDQAMKDVVAYVQTLRKPGVPVVPTGTVAPGSSTAPPAPMPATQPAPIEPSAPTAAPPAPGSPGVAPGGKPTEPGMPSAIPREPTK